MVDETPNRSWPTEGGSVETLDGLVRPQAQLVGDGRVAKLDVTIKARYGSSSFLLVVPKESTRVSHERCHSHRTIHRRAPGMHMS